MRDISQAIRSVQNFGSVELYVQDGMVTQITTRTIKKTAAPKKSVVWFIKLLIDKGFCSNYILFRSTLFE